MLGAWSLMRFFSFRLRFLISVLHYHLMILINWWTRTGFWFGFFFFFFENPFGLVLFRIDIGLFFPWGGLAIYFLFFLRF